MSFGKQKDKGLSYEEKFIISKIIAQNYLKGGQFGYKKGKELIQKQLNYKIPSATYNNCLTTIVRMAFRELEEFIAKNTSKKIEFINHQQQGIIRTPLIRCRQWMKQDHINTFFKLISNYYQLGTGASVTKNEALSLYNQIQLLLENCQMKQEIMYQKRNSKQTNSRVQKSTKSNQQKHNPQIYTKNDLKEEKNLDQTLKNQYFFQAVDQQSQVKKGQIDLNKFPADLEQSKKQQEIQLQII